MAELLVAASLVVTTIGLMGATNLTARRLIADGRRHALAITELSTQLEQLRLLRPNELEQAITIDETSRPLAFHPHPIAVGRIELRKDESTLKPALYRPDSQVQRAFVLVLPNLLQALETRQTARQYVGIQKGLPHLVPRELESVFACQFHDRWPLTQGHEDSTHFYHSPPFRPAALPRR